MKQEMYDIMFSVNDYEFFYLSILYHFFLILAYIFVYNTDNRIAPMIKLKTTIDYTGIWENNIYGANLKLSGTGKSSGSDCKW